MIYFKIKMLSTKLNLISLKKCSSTFIRTCTTQAINSTICNLSTAPGRAAISIVRVSGKQVKDVIKQMTVPSLLPKKREMRYRKVVDPISREVLDNAYVVYFEAPTTYTGEDLCEFHLHGSPAVVNAVLEGLIKVPNVRLALPGEFTRRGFYNNKFDLTAVEAIDDLLKAETDQQRRQANSQYKGTLAKVFNDWRNILINAIANIEAKIDFSETEDFDVDFKSFHEAVQGLIANYESYLQSSQIGITIKDGIKIAIYGAPNVGKSSLFNTICKSNRAIVSPTAGTTRDIIESKIDVKGYPITLLDTAGLKDQTSDLIEAEGIYRATNLLKHNNTHLHILVISLTDYLTIMQKRKISLFDYIKQYLKQLGLNELIDNDACDISKLFLNETLIVLNKADLLNDNCRADFNIADLNMISCNTKEGINEFMNTLECHLKNMFGNGGDESARLTSLRQVSHLTDSLMYLKNSLPLLENRGDVDLAILCDHLRKALRNLGFITGHTFNEEILDVIFKDFCIGK